MRERIRVVPTERVRPHEIADPARAERIERRLKADGVLRDPVVVGTLDGLEDYILLDGTNRKQALGALGVPWIMVQMVDYADPHQVQLRTWCHATERSLAHLLEGARAIAGLKAIEVPPLEAPGALTRPEVLALLLGPDGGNALTRIGDPAPSRADQLRRLVDLYETNLRRVDCDPEDVEEQARTLTGSSDRPHTLIAFPAFTRSQVVTMATRGTFIPAGITRHVLLSGRALRINLPLDALGGANSLEAANEQLQDHLRHLSPRLYREPTILFDS